MASKSKSKNLKNTVSTVVKLLVAAALITYLIRSGHLDPKDLWDLMTPFNVILALALVGLSTVMAAWRWIILLRARGLEISLFYGISLYLIGIFFNHALPGSVGGDVVRGYYLVADFPDRRADSILSIVIDRVLGLYSFFVLTLVAVLFDFQFVMEHEQVRWIGLGALALFLGMTLFFTIVFSQRLSRLCGLGFFERHVQAVHKLVMAFHRFGQSRSTIAVSVCVSLLAQIITMAFFYQIAIMSGESAISWRAVLFAVPMGFLVTAVPISPAGVGVGQVAFLYLFKVYLQHDTQFGATAITAYQLCVACWGLVGAALYLRRRKPSDLEDAVAEMA